jgi:hypothetical protein
MALDRREPHEKPGKSLISDHVEYGSWDTTPSLVVPAVELRVTKYPSKSAHVAGKSSLKGTAIEAGAGV